MCPKPSRFVLWHFISLSSTRPLFPSPFRAVFTQLQLTATYPRTRTQLATFLLYLFVYRNFLLAIHSMANWQISYNDLQIPWWIVQPGNHNNFPPSTTSSRHEVAHHVLPSRRRNFSPHTRISNSHPASGRKLWSCSDNAHNRSCALTPAWFAFVCLHNSC